MKKFIMGLVVVCLVVSVIGNFLLYNKAQRNRTQMQIGDYVVTQKLLHDWLWERHGIETQIEVAKYELVMQAAKRANLSPDPKEVEEYLKDLTEQVPAKAAEFASQPWKKAIARREQEYKIALANLMTRDVQATDADLQDFFQRNPGRWDLPDKLHLRVIECADRATADKAVTLMQQQISDMTLIQQQLDPKGQVARIAGVDGTMVVAKPTGKPAQSAMINQMAAMKPNEVRVFPGQSRFLVVKMVKIEPGKQVNLEEVKAKVARDFKLTRATPMQEVLRKLWDENQDKIVTDPPTLKYTMKAMIFNDISALEEARSAQ